jgi:hypothetical protein
MLAEQVLGQFVQVLGGDVAQDMEDGAHRLAGVGCWRRGLARGVVPRWTARAEHRLRANHG